MATATATIAVGTLAGTVNRGNLGDVPLIRVAGPMPRLRNNGWNCFSGQSRLSIVGLADALPDEGRPLRQGHVVLRYDDGKEFGTYTSTIRGNDTYDFS